jgi:hypothetical protein
VSSVFSQSNEKRNFSRGLMIRFLGFLYPQGLLLLLLLPLGHLL